MPKVTIIGPGIVTLCPHIGPHGRVHATWRSRDGSMGVCMMTDSHLENAIRLVLKSMQSVLQSFSQPGDDQYNWIPEYHECEDKLETLNRERHRRELLKEPGAIDLNAGPTKGGGVPQRLADNTPAQLPLGAGDSGSAPTGVMRSNRVCSPIDDNDYYSRMAR